MGQTANHRNNKVIADKSIRMVRLLENEDFKQLIMQDYIEQGILEQTLNMGLSNPVTIDQLKARQNLHSHIFSVLTNVDKLSSN